MLSPRLILLSDPSLVDNVKVVLPASHVMLEPSGFDLKPPGAPHWRVSKGKITSVSKFAQGELQAKTRNHAIV